ncbi:hypothetical protein [Paenibacillus lautus]|uniref:hypothetical protein n=1 Tax=Paenibacillus lautus TaxID=1401 RepID=UPI003D265F1B
MNLPASIIEHLNEADKRLSDHLKLQRRYGALSRVAFARPQFAQEGSNRPKARNGGAGITSLAPPFPYYCCFFHQSIGFLERTDIMEHTDPQAKTFSFIVVAIRPC